VWIGFSLLRIRSSGGLLWTWYSISGLPLRLEFLEKLADSKFLKEDSAPLFRIFQLCVLPRVANPEVSPGQQRMRMVSATSSHVMNAIGLPNINCSLVPDIVFLWFSPVSPSGYLNNIFKKDAPISFTILFSS